MNRKITLVFGFVFLLVILSMGVSAADASVCCEKTKNGFYCQDVPSTECAQNSRQIPTACSSTSFCNPGVCSDSKEGTCATNTPSVVCTANNGTWSALSPPQCQLGCCLLGDQAAFVTLTRCKKLSSQLGLATNYDKTISDETQCVLTVKNTEKGACVYESEFQKTCKTTTRAECSSGINGTKTNGNFYVGKLCSAEELGTVCAPTDKTTCVPGKDGVYFVDTCGNAANIYDSSKLKDTNYWSNIKDISESCGAGSANSLSTNCGNCNYLQGSFCRPVQNAGTKANYGNFICADLNCEKTSNGNAYKHGESWCVYNDKGTLDNGDNAVGSRFYKHICVNGEELVEQCADYRQEECISDKITLSGNSFSQAACRVNRWQDCTAQDAKQDCENTDRRDCLWKDKVAFGNRTEESGACIPKNTPGLKFWEGDDAKLVCAQANAQCIVKFEKGLLGGGMKCKDNCECLTPQWQAQRVAICTSLGDCGPKTNWVGSAGYKPGFNVTRKSA